MSPAAASTTTSANSLQSGQGYPEFAKFLCSDRDFFIFRKFNELAVRNLLYLQDELAELEEKLRTMDTRDAQNENPRTKWNLRSRRDDNNIERRVLMKQIETKLQSYRESSFRRPKSWLQSSPTNGDQVRLYCLRHKFLDWKSRRGFNLKAW